MPSILWDHHIIPKPFEDHEVIQFLGGKTLIQSPHNRIYLPQNQALAEKMGLTSHPGDHIDAYWHGVENFLNDLMRSPDYVAATSEMGEAATAAGNRIVARFNKFQNAVRIGLINGDILTNAQSESERAAANRKTVSFLANWEQYADGRPDQMRMVSELQRTFDEKGIGHTGKFMSLLSSDKVGMAEKIRALEAALEQDPSRRLVSAKDPGNLDYFKRIVADHPNSNPFTSLRPDEVPQLKGRPIQNFNLWNPGYPAAPQQPTILSTSPLDPKDVPYPSGFPIGPRLPDLPASTWVPQVPTVYLARGDDAINNVISDEALLAALAMAVAPELGGAAISLAFARSLGAPAVARMLATRGAAATRGGGALAPGLPRYLGLGVPGAMLATPAAATDADTGDRTPQAINQDSRSSSEPQPWNPRDPDATGQKYPPPPADRSSDFVNPSPSDRSWPDRESPSPRAPIGMLSDLTFDPVGKRWLTLPEGVSQIVRPQQESATEGAAEPGIAWPGLLFRTDWPANSDTTGWDDTTARAPDYWTMPPSISPQSPPVPTSPFFSLAPAIPPASARSLNRAPADSDLFGSAPWP